MTFARSTGVPRNLNASFGWADALAQLGVAVPGPALPAAVDCPACGGTLVAYADPCSRSHGEWLRCGGCDFRGGAIELAARVWGVDLPAAVQRLAERGLFRNGEPPADAVDRWVRSGPARQAQHREMAARLGHPDRWEAEHREARALLEAAGVPAPRDPDDWRAGAGRGAGFLWAEEVEREAHPGSANSRGTHYNCSRERIFHGGGWRVLLAVPHEDLPGRVRSWWFLGRRAEPVRDERGWWVPPYGLATSFLHTAGQYDPGFGFRASLDPIDGEFGRQAAVLFDPLALVRLWAAAGRLGETTLPAVSCWRLGTRPARPHRQALGGRRAVVWGRRTDLGLLEAARQLDARVASPDGPGPGQPPEAASAPGRSPRGWLGELIERARPWRERAEAAAARLAGPEADRLRSSLGLGSPWAAVPAPGGPEPTPEERSCRLGPDRYHALHGAWYRDTPQGRVLLCEGSVHLDRLVAVEGGEVWAEGEVRRGAAAAPFRDRLEALRSGSFGWLAARLAAAGLPAAAYDPGRSRNLLGVALGMSSPPTVRGLGRAGWDPVGRAVVCERFAVPAEADPLVEIGRGLRRPTEHLPPPGPLPPEAVRSLDAAGAAAEAAWAALHWVLENVLAAAWGRPARGVVLPGRSAGAFLAAAAACGADPLSAKRLRDRPDVDRVHGWPAFLPASWRPALLSPRLGWLAAGGERRLALTARPRLAHLLPAVCPSWHLWEGRQEARGLPTALADALGRAASNYLADLAGRGWAWVPPAANTPAGERPFDRALLADLTDWWRRRGGNPSAPARALVGRQGPPADAAEATRRIEAVLGLAAGAGDTPAGRRAAEEALAAAGLPAF